MRRRGRNIKMRRRPEGPSPIVSPFAAPTPRKGVFDTAMNQRECLAKGESSLMKSHPMFAVVGFMTCLSLSAAAEPADPAPLLRIGGGATPTGVCRIAFVPDGKTIACIGAGPVRLYDAVSGKLRRSLKMDAKCLAFATNGKTVAVGEGAFVHVCNVETGEESVPVQGAP